jgi:hypothetical protein
MNSVCQRCKGTFCIEYNPSKIMDYSFCQFCNNENVEEKSRGCNRCNPKNPNKRLCDLCVEESCCVRCERGVLIVVLIPVIPFYGVYAGYFILRNKCLGRHWSEGLIR